MRPTHRLRRHLRGSQAMPGIVPTSTDPSDFPFQCTTLDVTEGAKIGSSHVGTLEVGIPTVFTGGITTDYEVVSTQSTIAQLSVAALTLEPQEGYTGFLDARPVASYFGDLSASTIVSSDVQTDNVEALDLQTNILRPRAANIATGALSFASHLLQMARSKTLTCHFLVPVSFISLQVPELSMLRTPTEFPPQYNIT